MDEYIRKETAMEIIKRTSGDYAAAWVEVRKAPAADVAPVVHGEWKEYDGEDRGYHYCTNCEQQAFNYAEDRNVIEVLSDYCPKCGAKMDGGTHEKQLR